MEQPSEDWLSCTLCRSGRQGASTLRKAGTRAVEWPEPNIGLTNPLEDAVIHTSLDDAFATMTQYMTISSRKCGRYHNSHKPHKKHSAEDKHCRRYHSPHSQSATITNPLSRPAAVHVEAAPGTYAVTAARWGDKREPGEERGRETTHVVRVQPGQSISLTLSV